MAEEQKTFSEEFTLKQGSENYNEVQRAIDELENAKIMHTNYQRYFQQVDNNTNIIKAQIENLFSNYGYLREEFNNMKDRDDVKNAYENGFIPIEFYNVLFNLSRSLNDMLCWQIYQNELRRILLSKLKPALEEARSLDIERDVLKELREMERERSKLFLDSIRSVSGTFKESVFNHIDKMRVDSKENIHLLIGAMKELQNSHKEMFKELNIRTAEHDIFNGQLSSLDAKNKRETKPLKHEEAYEEPEELPPKENESEKEEHVYEENQIFTRLDPKEEDKKGPEGI